MDRIMSPSILAADYLNLERDIRNAVAWGADWLHVDVMDAHFVRPLTFGAPMVAQIRKICGIPLDVHLMTDRPEQIARDVLDAGADIVTFHVEAAEDPAALIAMIHERGSRAGIALKPYTPLEAVVPYLETVDMVLVMTVEPGYGGQKLMPHTLEKAKALRERCPDLAIQADGGLCGETIRDVVRSGVNVMVAGSAVFKAEDPSSMIRFWKTFDPEDPA